jgi:polyribonucleotide nucleotidyltransferase
MNMIEMDGNEIAEDNIEKAFVLGQEMIDKLCEIQNDFLNKFSNKKDLLVHTKYNYPSDAVKTEVGQIINHDQLQRLFKGSKSDWELIFSGRRKELREHFKDKMNSDEDEVKAAFTREKIHMAMELIVREYFRELILDNQIRIDGRKLDEIRALYCDTGLLGQVHGSALFWRGDTQILNTCTLGAPGDIQLTDDMLNDATEKRYMHHYNFPPFSVNEAMRIRGTGNREIGHGRLAEKALEFVLPPKSEFPYAIRLVSDCLSS